MLLSKIKILFVVLILSLFSGCGSSSDTFSDVDVGGSQMVDDFATGDVVGRETVCDVENIIDGDVWIRNRAVQLPGSRGANRRVSELIGVTQIKGKLTIWGKVDRNLLNALHCVKYVGGYLSIREIEIVDSEMDEDEIDFLPSLEKLGGSLNVDDNKEITSFVGLNKLKYIYRQLHITNNPSIVSVNAFNSLEKISGSFAVYNNDNLTEIRGFESLAEVDVLPGVGVTLGNQGSTGLSIFHNPNLVSIEMPALRMVADDFHIMNNDSLNYPSVHYFPGCRGYGGACTEEDPYEILAEFGFDSLEYVGDNIRVYHNNESE